MCTASPSIPRVTPLRNGLAARPLALSLRVLEGDPLPLPRIIGYTSAWLGPTFCGPEEDWQRGNSATLWPKKKQACVKDRGHELTFRGTRSPARDSRSFGSLIGCAEMVQETLQGHEVAVGAKS